MSELERVQAENQALRDQLAVLRQQMDWLKKQLFGRKSERGGVEGQGELDLELEEEGSGEALPPPAKEVTSSRGGKKRVTRARRLPDHLPVREEVLVPPAVQAQPEAWRRIGEESRPLARGRDRLPGRAARRARAPRGGDRVNSPRRWKKSPAMSMCAG